MAFEWCSAEVLQWTQSFSADPVSGNLVPSLHSLNVKFMILLNIEN